MQKHISETKGPMSLGSYCVQVWMTHHPALPDRPLPLTGTSTLQWGLKEQPHTPHHTTHTTPHTPNAVDTIRGSVNNKQAYSSNKQLLQFYKRHRRSPFLQGQWLPKKQLCKYVRINKTQRVSDESPPPPPPCWSGAPNRGNQGKWLFS